MVVLPSSSGYRPNKGVKREHDPDQIHDISSKSPNANGTSNNHTHQHKKKKSHHPQNQAEQSGGGKKRKKSKHKSSQSQQQDTLMSGGLGDMSVELGEPILSPPDDSQDLTPKVATAMEVKHAKMNKDGGGGKKKKNKTKKNRTVHFEEPSSNYRPPHVVDEEEEAEIERFEMNRDTAARETSNLPVRSHSPILPPTSSPILPPTRPKRSLSHGPPPPILPQASPSRMNPLYVPPTISTPILPPASPFRRRRGSTDNAFSQPPPTFSTEASSPQTTQSTRAKPTSAKSAAPKSKDDEWEFSTGKFEQ
ncbi:putative ribosomal protein l27 protein [Botrytis fragariae]|uniref:Putative ribosomal protein l27 protein n=1 Tax=Botrytis fragariae TaxID=1964551 RepID=A0A8H6ALW1_9HELO|nr:putative ribosomal protein l27 protein [Botrytis fragariae]KAF5869645.1 putative ribosomal protein l27 protein [Botrytis fragariae]